jgi:pyridoxine 4-dehydrogenase
VTLTAKDNQAAAAGTFTIGGDLTVNRLGYGAMRITGEGIWGPPRDKDEALAVLRRTVELGITFIDTADSYGPEVSEALIAEALHPYADDLVIATKAGLTRQGPDIWTPVGRPAYLRQQCELSLRRLGVERIDLFQLHRIDAEVPVAEQVGELKALQDEGKIRHIGLSEVSVEELQEAQKTATIASVQNRFAIGDRGSEPLLKHCEDEGIAFIPWRPIADHVAGAPQLLEVAEAHDANATQVALAWLLELSPVMVPIPGTSSVRHLEENTAAAGLSLSSEDMAKLNEL